MLVLSVFEMLLAAGFVLEKKKEKYSGQVSKNRTFLTNDSVLVEWR